jgi:general secretion pathway protein D
VQYPKGTPELSVKWQDIGVSMQIVPTILPNDFVQLEIQQLEVTEVTGFENSRGIDLPRISKRSQTGFVQVPSGQTLVIGGLSSRVTRETERRIPVVGKLPLIGFPFRGRKSEAQVGHLLIFVAPTIVDLRHLTKDSHNALQFWQRHAGEWSSSERIQEEIEVMQDER